MGSSKLAHPVQRNQYNQHTTRMPWEMDVFIWINKICDYKQKQTANCNAKWNCKLFEWFSRTKLKIHKHTDTHTCSTKMRIMKNNTKHIHPGTKTYKQSRLREKNTKCKKRNRVEKKRVAKQFERDCKNHRRIQWVKHHRNIAIFCTPCARQTQIEENACDRIIETEWVRERIERERESLTRPRKYIDAIANILSQWKCTEQNSARTKLKLSEAWVNYIAKNKTISQFIHTHPVCVCVGVCTWISNFRGEWGDVSRKNHWWFGIL